MSVPGAPVKARLLAAVDRRRDRLVDLCARLIAAPSENPPSDTRAAAQVAAGFLRGVPGADVSLHTLEAPVVNVVARLRGRGPGRRLVFNGHLDTFPAGDPAAWTAPPFSPQVRDGRLYGRGAADMKGGVACALMAFLLLAERRDAWDGELVVTLAGDEERMGERGTAFLLRSVACAAGDAMISADLGSPAVLRFGEKGFLWLELRAEGIPAHGAHVHLGVNAVHRLVDAIACLKTQLPAMCGAPPDAVRAAIRAAAPVSERFSGAGETEVLESVTVNVGQVEGGVSANTVPAGAVARVDVRVPAGLTTAQVEAGVRDVVAAVGGVSYHVLRRCEPNWSDPRQPIFALTAANVRQVTGLDPVVTLRVGASDARLYRLLKGVPAVSCGLTPHGVGGPDEYAEIDELVHVAQIHAATAFDFLRSGCDAGPRPRCLQGFERE